MNREKSEKITLGGGCFWCVEAVFQRIEGVISVISGYAGGTTENPSYQQICTGNTGHAEVIKVGFEPEKITLAEILDIFWQAHDPTTLNRQGNDVGTQYRSVIFYENEQQREIAEKSKTEAAAKYRDPIVTEISPLPKFYPAEGYHQNYFNDNPWQPYCQFVIKPKVSKLEKEYSAKLRK